MQPRRDISPEEIIRALRDDPGFGFQDTTDYLRKGKCPGCGKRTLYIGKQQPWVLRCERLNKCGFEESVREALPDIFADFANRYPPTEENRHATADAYLGLDRGFDLSRIRGWYEQAAWAVPGTSEHVPTIRFYLDEARTRYWERLIGRTKKDGQKAHFGGTRKDDGTLFRGDVWSPPDQALEQGDRCFLVEGIFHAIALNHAGQKAAAAFSCNHFPEAFVALHKGKGIRWVIALDADAAGKKYARAHHKRLKEMGELATVLLLPDGKDWDDLWREQKINDAFISERLYHGRLYMAETVEEKAYHYYVRNRRMSFLIDFRNAIYSITLPSAFEKDLAVAAGAYCAAKAESGEAVAGENPIEGALKSKDGRDLFKQHCDILQISNIHPRFLYMERDVLVDEQRYVFGISYSNEQPDDIIALEGTAITSPDAFHKALLNRSRGGTFDGNMQQLKILRDRWLNKRMTTVQALPFVGYDRDTAAYIFQQHAWHNGRRIAVNENGYFDINRVGIKTVLNGVYINTDGKFSQDWIVNFAKAFHWQGLATLAFWFGSLFVQQIRAMHKTFPFLELTGEPGAGKSTILEFLWKLVGREDYEGFDLLKSSPAGRRRAFSQVSNLPVVIIESDRDNGDQGAKQRQFGFDEVKPFFNGRGTGTLGVARRSNDVEEHLFQGSLLISQNAEVDGSEALLQRIVHCHADKAHHKAGTRELARWFERQTSSDVGGFLAVALANERKILDTYAAAFERLEAQYAAHESLKNERIIKNHAQVAACGEALAVVFPDMKGKLTEGLTEYLRIRAKVREQRLAADHPLLEQFWEMFEYLANERNREEVNTLNHSKEPGIVAINLNHVREAAQAKGQPLIDMQQLKKLLPHGKKYKLLDANRTVWSCLLEKSIKCWVFQRK